MRHLLLMVLLVLSIGCAPLSTEQRAEIELLRAQVSQAEQGVRSHSEAIAQARKDFDAGRLTTEQLNALVVRSQEQINQLVQTGNALAAKAKDLEKQGIPQWQTMFETLWPSLLAAGGTLWLAKQGDKKTKDEAVAKVMELRGPPRPKLS